MPVADNAPLGPTRGLTYCAVAQVPQGTGKIPDPALLCRSSSREERSTVRRGFRTITIVTGERRRGTVRSQGGAGARKRERPRLFSRAEPRRRASCLSLIPRGVILLSNWFFQ
ncbi:hypothetical protein Taro_008464 [Colocasia esculenta]|uniref:Uncharacterized protein n=1 Tax=Colocasia esculenta TaxID=4460 RepID=A0A843U334_COLES|nr:hypothetical protein [Colocasia esculenta]